MTRRTLFVPVFGLILLLAVACTSATDDSTNEDGSLATSTSTTVAETTTTLPPLPPQLSVPDVARAEIGQTFADAVVATDRNSDDTMIEVVGRVPDGFAITQNARGRLTGFTWEPELAGEWDVDFTASDTTGLSTTETVRLVSRFSRETDLMLAMGDSVAAGFGRDRIDFGGSDECFRSEGDSYARHTYDALIEAGSLPGDAEWLTVACAGATAARMTNLRVTATTVDGDLFGEPLSQLDFAVRQNPTIITLTIGSSDVSLFDAAALTETDSDQDPTRAIDQFYVDNMLGQFETHLGILLDTLVRSTDSRIVVTTWYDPTAAIPVGVDGCTGQCMVDVMAAVVSSTNSVIVDAADSQPRDRIRLARLDGDADIWEAENGIGPDALRDGLGPLQGVVDAFTGGINATCADSGSPAQDLISSLDCSHPNDAGHRAIAEVVTATLLRDS